MKARSRLQTQPSVNTHPVSPTTPVHPTPIHEPSKTAAREPRKSLHHQTENPWSERLAGHAARWQWLAVSLIGYSVIYFLVTMIRPALIQNLVFANSYLPFQILLLISNIFFFGWIWQSPRRGMLTAVALQVLVTFKLQQFSFSIWLLLLVLAGFVIIELFSGTILFVGRRVFHLVPKSAPSWSKRTRRPRRR